MSYLRAGHSTGKILQTLLEHLEAKWKSTWLWRWNHRRRKTPSCVWHWCLEPPGAVSVLPKDSAQCLLPFLSVLLFCYCLVLQDQGKIESELKQTFQSNVTSGLGLDRRAYVGDGKLVGPKHREHRTIWISGNGFQETAQHSVFQGLGTHAE